MRQKPIPFVERSDIFRPTDIEAVLQSAVNASNVKGTSKGVYYYNVPCSFDIETTSFYRDEEGATFGYTDAKDIERRTGCKLEKCSVMYVWQFGINGVVVMGRTWDEFLTMCRTMAQVLELSDKRILVVYVHNLSFEFQFLSHLFEWDKVFSIEERKPIYARTTTHIEFRCSYLLSGYSLAKLGEQLQKYKVQKLVGDLDYSLLRHSGTPLTEQEIAYCVNDIRVVMAYIQEKIENEGGITSIPMTKTGYVRKYCRKECCYYRNEDGKRCMNFRYNDLISECTISGYDEFRVLMQAFQGGFTHANAFYVNDILHNVASYDFTSSYPYVMVSEKFPMSRGIRVQVQSREEFELYLKKYCCVFQIAFENLYTRIGYENYLSVAKCRNTKGVVSNNGRVSAAAYVETTMTNVDYELMQKCYSWDSCTVGLMYCYRKGFLPTEFVKSILNLYEKKTTLKGVAGKEVEYLASKEMVNACYGMTVTNPLRDEFIFDGEQWLTQAVSRGEAEELLDKYNKQRNRFLFYPWGVFVTAYARRNLWSGIFEFKDDYVYSDTDSVKVLNYERHLEYIRQYNDLVESKLKLCCCVHHVPFSMIEPKTIKGVAKRLGVWDFEGVYSDFKTLGAKRYMVKKDGEFSLTVSGVNKKMAIPYLLRTYGENGIMDAFTENLYIPPQGTGKNIHTYIDYEIQGELTDYKGVTAPFMERSGVHLEATDYTMNMSCQFIQYLMGIRHTKQ